MKQPGQQLVKEAKPNKPIYILGDPKSSNFSAGIAPHPLQGIGHIKNLDIKTNPGSIRINNQLSKVSSTTVTGLLNWIRQDPVSGTVWGVDNGGKVYKFTPLLGSWSVVAGNSGTQGGGLEIWKGYLIVQGSIGLDAYGPLASSPSWTQNFAGTLDYSAGETLTPIFKSIDDCLYIGNGRYVDRIQEVTTFAPGTGSTFTYTMKAITLATGYIVTAFQDLGYNLMIGTQYLYSQQKADIFPYTRNIATALLGLPGLPIHIAEQGVSCMLTVANRLYVLAGQTGKIFITDSSSATQIAQIPNYVSNIDGGAPLYYGNDAIMYLKGKIWFGIGNNGVGNGGVWSYDPITKALVMENSISTGDDGSSGLLLINTMIPLGVDYYVVGWRDGSTYGADALLDTQRYGNYTAYIDSPLVKIGTALNKSTVPQVELNLTKPLLNGQGIELWWRSNIDSLNDALSGWNEFPSAISFANYGSIQTLNISASFMTNLVFLQMRALLTAVDANYYTFTVTITSPAVFTCANHGLAVGMIINLATTGALPTGLTAGSIPYYIISTGFTANSFQVSTSLGGSAVNTSGSQSGTQSFTVPSSNYSPELESVLLLNQS